MKLKINLEGYNSKILVNIFYVPFDWQTAISGDIYADIKIVTMLLDDFNVIDGNFELNTKVSGSSVYRIDFHICTECGLEFPIHQLTQITATKYYPIENMTPLFFLGVFFFTVFGFRSFRKSYDRSS